MPERASPEKLTAERLASEKLTLERRYTTRDFTALRAFLQRIPPAVIARVYYDPDEDAHAATPGAMERHLHTMLDTPGGARARARLDRTRRGPSRVDPAARTTEAHGGDVSYGHRGGGTGCVRPWRDS